jgi:hypothetical protein
MAGVEANPAREPSRPLQDQACHESTGETRDKDHRGYHGDQVNRPWVVASTDKFDMAGAVFVSICMKAHGSGLHLLSEGPPFASTEYHVLRRAGAA